MEKDSSEFTLSLFGVARQCAGDADFYTNGNPSALKGRQNISGAHLVGANAWKRAQ